VIIEDGELIEGTIDEDAVGAFGGEIVDTIVKQYSETRARVFINEIAALAMRAIMHFGFSIGIDDESIPAEAEEQVDEAIANAYDRIEELIETYRNGDLESLPGRTVDETLEMKIMQTLGKARDSAGEIADDHFTDDNPAVVMARSGARGSMLNLTQMAGCVGQQAVRGERINRGYENRTLAHYEEGDLSAEAHGFVENSYRSGLTPREFFFHAMGGREGLVDTAVRTSKSGYLQRRLIKPYPNSKPSTTAPSGTPPAPLCSSSSARTAPRRFGCRRPRTSISMSNRSPTALSTPSSTARNRRRRS